MKLFREADPSFTQALEVEVKERIFAPQEYLLHLGAEKQANLSKLLFFAMLNHIERDFQGPKGNPAVRPSCCAVAR